MILVLFLKAIEEHKKSNKINDRYALAVVGHEDQGFQGYSALKKIEWKTSMQGQCGHKWEGDDELRA